MVSRSSARYSALNTLICRGAWNTPELVSPASRSTWWPRPACGSTSVRSAASFAGNCRFVASRLASEVSATPNGYWWKSTKSTAPPTMDGTEPCAVTRPDRACAQAVVGVRVVSGRGQTQLTMMARIGSRDRIASGSAP